MDDDSKRLLREVALAIDWDEQNASRFYIGEDAATAVLARLGFDWDMGLNNESVEKFLKE
jgi:hypothetical protein